MKLIKTKTINLELELIGRNLKNTDINGISDTYYFKDINNIFNLKDNLLLINAYSPFNLNDYGDFTDLDDEYVDVCAFKTVYSLYDTEFDLIEDLIPIILKYLEQNKLPYSYLDAGNNYSENTLLTDLIIEKINNNIFKSIYKGYGDILGDSMYFEWQINNNVLYINNKYLSKEFKLTSINSEEIDKYILKYNKEWNSIIDGRFKW